MPRIMVEAYISEKENRIGISLKKLALFKQTQNTLHESIWYFSDVFP